MTVRALQTDVMELHMIAGPIVRHFSWRSFALSAMICLGLPACAAAQPFPSNTIRIVVPPGPGTPPDIISRIVANELIEAEGWRVVVENRPGALQTIGMADVLKHPADGYTLLAMSVPVTVAPALLPAMGLQPEADFAPIVQVSKSYLALVVTPLLQARSVSELVSLLKSKPGQLNFSSGGYGTPAHLIGEMFKLRTGVQATHVPYQTVSQSLGDLIGGTIQYQFITTLPVTDLIAAGKLRAIAVTSPHRLAILKDVPTVVEQGFPDLAVEDWVGFAARGGTPPEIVARLNEAMNKALAKPKVREAFAKIGAEPAGGTPSEFGQVIESQVAYWANIIKQAEIKMPQ
jgi:tripartite-type tricarboxylate transporter receptor subunit TctC